MLHSIRNNSFEHVDEYVMGLEDKITESDSKIEECNTTIATLQKENEEAAELYNTIKTEHDNSLVELEKLTQENEQLTSYKAAAELAKKEAILTKYSAQLDNETIDGFRGELDNYTEEGLEKELAFVLVQSKPAIFTTEEKVPNFVPKDDSHNGGIEEILSRYKK